MPGRRGMSPKALLPWLGLALSMVMVLSAWFFLRRAQLHRIHDRFEAEAALMQVRVADRVAAHEQILRGAAEFISRGQALPTRREWRHFAQALDLDHNNPGVQALGFAEWIPLPELERHIRRLRAEGFPDYAVHPGGPLPREGGVSSIIYTEPFDDLNRKTFAKDMLAEATRKQAMVRARDTGAVSISGKLRLYQEGSDPVQTGTVLYVPVYRRGMPTGTVDQRRAALLGWAYMAFRMGNLLEGTLGQSSQGIQLELFDGDSERGENLLYAGHGFPSEPGPSWVNRAHFDVAGRVWTLLTVPDPAIGRSPEDTSRMEILVLGLLFSGAIFGLLRSFARRERQALAVADERLRKVQALLDSTGEAIYGIDLRGQCTFCNPALLRMLGYERMDQVLGRNMHDLIHHSLSDGSPMPVEQCRIFKAFREGMPAHVDDEVLWRADGSSFPAEYWSHPQYLDGQVIGAVVTFLDITERKRSEAALRLSQESLNLALTSSGMGTFEWDVQRDIQQLDATVCRLIGIDPRTFTGTAEEVIAAIHPEDRAFVRSSFTRALVDGHYETHYRAVWGDGSVHHIAVQGRLFLDAQGRPAKLNGVLWDVTRQRSAEEAVRKITVAVDQSPVTVVITDVEGRIEYVNPKFTQMTGYTAAEAMGQNPRILKSGDYPPEAYRNLWLTINAGEIWKGEFHNRKKDGELFWESATIAPIRDSAGAITNFVAIKEDITEFKRAEEARIESETRFRELFETSKDGILTLDLEGRYQDCNQAFLDLLELESKQQLISRSYEEFTPGEYLEEERRVIAECQRFNQGGSQAFTKEYFRKSGDRIQVELRIWARRDREGKAMGLWAMVRDITERAKAEQEKQKLQARLQQAQRMESLGILAAGVAHNINNVLAIILGTASLRAQSATEPADVKAYATIERVCIRGRDVVRSLMQFGQPSIQDLAPFELNLMVREVRTLLENTTRNTIRMVEDLVAEPVWISGDSGSINHSLLNLCLNAIYAMPNGGTLTFRTAIPEDGWAELAVEDTGCGMEAEVLAHVMEPFFTTKAVDQGTGLGLSMTYGVVKAHGGILDVASQPGQGTVVRIRIPRRAAPVEPEGPTEEPAQDLRELRVLLVDDDIDVQFLVARMLRKAGVHQVDTVSSGQEALESLRAGELPSLVILDQNMPGLNGAQTLKRIRALHPAMPVLISSGQPGLEEIAEFRQPGVGIIPKPFTLEEIQEKLARFERGPGPL